MTKRVQNQARQGDVLILRIGSTPSVAKSLPTAAVKAERENGRAVLAHGEATGHHHSFGSRATNQYAHEEGRYAVVGGRGDTLQHLDGDGKQADHDPIAFAPGAFEVRTQREWIESEMVRVAD